MSKDFLSNIQGAINEAAEQTNMNEAQAGGGDRRMPEAGLARLRFISYIEVGNHHDARYDKNKDEVILQFELSGPKHEPFEVNGKKIPFIITIREGLYLNEKANFYKLFRRMNHEGTATHMAQLLGKEFLGTVVLRDNGKTGKEKRVYANLRDDGGYTIRPPFVEDVETGETRKVPVQEALTPLKCFIFDYATKEMWDSIFIDGQWDPKTDSEGNIIEEGRSKNIYQDQIKAAQNFEGSVIQGLLSGADELDTEVEKPARKEASEESSTKRSDDDELADI